MLFFTLLFVRLLCKCMCACMCTHMLTQSCVRTIAHQAPPRNFSCKNTGVSYHFLLQGLNLHLCVSCMSRQILYHCATWHPCMHIPYAYKMKKKTKNFFGSRVWHIQGNEIRLVATLSYWFAVQERTFELESVQDFCCCYSKNNKRSEF